MAMAKLGKRALRSGGPPPPAQEAPVLPDEGPIPDVITMKEHSESEADGDGVASDGASSDDDDLWSPNVAEEGESDGSDVYSSDGEEEEEEDDEDLRDIQEAMVDYLAAGPPDAQGIEDGEEEQIAASDDDDEAAKEQDEPKVEESDSSEDEMPDKNTVGDVPLEWYKNEEHIGYNKAGKKIRKKERRDQLDTFLAHTDDANGWRKIYDEYNDEEVELTKEEVDMIRRIRQGKIPHAEVNPYEPYVDWFEYEDKGHPLSSAPEPKRRFIPSKWEAKKVVKLVRALRKGWIKLDKQKEKPPFYLMWGDDLRTTDKTANGLAYIAAPKVKLPGHEESYNPPVEYIPAKEEINSYELMFEEDRPKFIPKSYPSLRQVPAYPNYIKEMFERCLDLYLCPRARKKRINIDPETLIPKLPKPRDLQPYPTTCLLEYRGHSAPVTTLSTDSSGEWLATGSQDGTVRLWDVHLGRCHRVWDIGTSVRHVQWNPSPQFNILAIAVEKEVLLLNAEVGEEDDQASAATLLSIKTQLPLVEESESVPLATWSQHEKFKGLVLRQQHMVHSLAWHHKGDYFATVAPDGNTRAVLVHQLTKQQTQNPFRKHHGRVVRVLFHPQRPFLFVATKMHVRVYNLAKQQLAKKLMTGLNEISAMAIHPGGDNLVLGSQESKMLWFDMDLSTKPYKSLKNHEKDIRAVAFHKSYPLFASCSDDGSAHVFHGMVYSDLLQNPLIVPLKFLYGHKTVNHRGVMDCAFHPRQPWLFTAGADCLVKLYCN